MSLILWQIAMANGIYNCLLIRPEKIARTKTNHGRFGKGDIHSNSSPTTCQTIFPLSTKIILAVGEWMRMNAIFFFARNFDCQQWHHSNDKCVFWFIITNSMEGKSVVRIPAYRRTMHVILRTNFNWQKKLDSIPFWIGYPVPSMFSLNRKCRTQASQNALCLYGTRMY